MLARHFFDLIVSRLLVHARVDIAGSGSTTTLGDHLCLHRLHPRRSAADLCAAAVCLAGCLKLTLTPVDVSQMMIKSPGIWIRINTFLSETNSLLHVDCRQYDGGVFVWLNKLRIQSRCCIQEGSKQLHIELSHIIQSNVALVT